MKKKYFFALIVFVVFGSFLIACSNKASTYTVTWKNYDGSILEVDSSVASGVLPTYDGEAPTKPSDSTYSYVFNSWTPAVVAVSSDATYTATFQSHLLASQVFTIVWKNYDGVTLETDTSVAYGVLPTYNGSTPTRPSDSSFTYTFSGWTPSVAPASEDAVYTATYDATPIPATYTITWLNYDGSVLETDTNVALGTTPSYDGSTPTKESDAQYDYTFSGWTPSIVSVTGNATYTAVYDSSEIVISYTITWLNYDGSILNTSSTQEGQLPVYNGETPTRVSGETWDYTFSGWTPTLAPATQDTSYTASFIMSFQISWFDEDGALIEVVNSEVDSYPTSTYVGLQDTAQWDYTFLGWSLTPGGSVLGSIPQCTSSADYYAVSTQQLKQYSISWFDEEGYSLVVDTMDYGLLPSNPYTGPSDNAQWDYTFLGWSLEQDGSITSISNVVSNVSYYAVVTKTLVEYDIYWYTETGAFYGVTSVGYGLFPYSDYTGPEDTVEWFYYVEFWSNSLGVSSNDLALVTGSVNYYAVVGQSHQKYDISWFDENDVLLSTEIVEYGLIPTHPYTGPANNAQWNYTFFGWSTISGGPIINPLIPVGGVQEYYAIVLSTLVNYTITWYDEDGLLLGTTVEAYGAIPSYTYAGPADTNKWDYSIIGWSFVLSSGINDITSVTGNTSYYAILLAEVQIHEIAWYDENSVFIEYTYVEYNDIPTSTYTGLPNGVQYSYLFKGWSTYPGGPASPVLPNVIGPATYYAVSVQILTPYTITWYDELGGILGTSISDFGTIPSNPYTGPVDDTDWDYTFEGWSLTPGGSVVALDPVDHDITYYAIVSAVALS